MPQISKYGKAALWPFPFNVSLIVTAIGTVALLTRTDFLSALIFSIGVVIFLNLFICLIKIILYPGQYGITAEFNLETGDIRVGKRKFNASDIKVFKHNSIRYYGHQAVFVLKSNKKHSIFSPQSLNFIADLLKYLSAKGIYTDSQALVFPYPGMKYTIK